jgi:hypothetical protein
VRRMRQSPGCREGRGRGAAQGKRRLVAPLDAITPQARGRELNLLVRMKANS